MKKLCKKYNNKKPFRSLCLQESLSCCVKYMYFNGIVPIGPIQSYSRHVRGMSVCLSVSPLGADFLRVSCNVLPLKTLPVLSFLRFSISELRPFWDYWYLSWYLVIQLCYDITIYDLSREHITNFCFQYMWNFIKLCNMQQYSIVVWLVCKQIPVWIINFLGLLIKCC